MTEKLQRIKCYYKYEIADMYEIDRKVFMNWLRNIECKLESAGYRKMQKILTLKQTEIIFNHLGHPPAFDDKNIHSGNRIKVIPYQKKRLAFFYGVSEGTLIRQIKSINNFDAVKNIMDSPIPHYWEMLTDKKYFKKEDVNLIFEHLGHPYYLQV